jgi:hypothetical protein
MVKLILDGQGHLVISLSLATGQTLPKSEILGSFYCMTKTCHFSCIYVYIYVLLSILSMMNPSSFIFNNLLNVVTLSELSSSAPPARHALHCVESFQFFPPAFSLLSLFKLTLSHVSPCSSYVSCIS